MDGPIIHVDRLRIYAGCWTEWQMDRSPAEGDRKAWGAMTEPAAADDTH